VPIAFQNEVRKKWQEALGSEEAKAADGLLDLFYDSLVASWFEEVGGLVGRGGWRRRERLQTKWLGAVAAGDPELLVGRGVQAALARLEPGLVPSVEQRLGDAPLAALQRCKASAVGLARTLARQLSDPVAALDLCRALLAPFARLALGTQQLEERHLLQQLSRLDLVGHFSAALLFHTTHPLLLPV